MLKFLRKRKNAKIILWILAIIIIPAFVFWGSNSLVRSQKAYGQYAGEISGKKISFPAYEASLDAVRTQMKMRFGEETFKKIEKILNLEAQAFDRLILLKEADLRKINVKDREVVERIESFPFLQRKGVFNKQLYDLYLKYDVGYLARDFEEYIRKSMQLAKLYEETTQGVSVGDKDVLGEYKNLHEETKISYIIVPADIFEKDIALEDNEIKDYYKEHSQDFKKEPEVNIEYLLLEHTKDASQDLKEEALFRAEEILKSAKKANSLESLKGKGIKLQETGFFKLNQSLPELGFVPNFNEASFNLELNGIYDKVIETPFGFAILKLKARKDSYIPDFAEAKENARKILIAQKAKVLSKQKSEEILKYAKDSKDLSLTAKNFNLELKASPFLKRKDYIPDIGLNAELSKAAFASKPNEIIGTVFETPSGFAVAMVDEFKGIDEKKFSEEKDKLKEELLSKKKEDLFQSWFDSLKKKANLRIYIPLQSPLQ